MNRFTKKWGLVLRVLVIVAVLLLLKGLINFFNLDVASANPLVTALVGGVIFTIAIIFTGTLADYKESERIPGELATSIKALYNDTRIIHISDGKITDDMRLHIRELLQIINSNLRQNSWRSGEINPAMEAINRDISILSEKGVAPPLLVNCEAN